MGYPSRNGGYEGATERAPAAGRELFIPAGAVPGVGQLRQEA